MIEEIIYTSAPKGLKQGSRGFCTVVSTTGMGLNVAERLESMSGYRHAYPLHDPNAALNPVNYAHVTTRLGGQSLHVLSRVADAGQDYSGRTNKLAHHIVVNSPESLTAGPARLLADPATVVTRWDGQVTTRPPRRLPNPAIPPMIHLTAWKSQTGDSGWAGWVAEQLQTGRRPVNVIFAAGTETLPLVVEILDLIPVPQRWNITFSTYFTRLLAGTECQLRFVLNGTAEATSLRNDARAVTVDLTRTLPPADGGVLVETARRGRLQFRQPKPTSAVRRETPETRPLSEADQDADLDAFLIQEPDPAAEPLPTAVSPRPATPLSAAPPPPLRRLDRAFSTRRTRHNWLPVVAAIVLLCSVGLAGFLLRDRLFASRAPARPNPNPPAAVANTDAPSRLPEPDTSQTPIRTAAPDASKQQSAVAKEVRSNVESQDPPELTEDVAPQPFAGWERPDGEPFVWNLASKPGPPQSEEITVYIESAGGISIESLSESVTIDAETKTTDPRTWTVSANNTLLGRIIAAAEAAEPNRITMMWQWNTVFEQPLAPDSDACRARRLLRDAVLQVQATISDKTHETQLRVTEHQGTPFRFLPSSTTNNLASPLQIPDFSPDMAERSSKPVYIEATPDKLELDIEHQFNNVIPNHSVILEPAPPNRSDPSTRSWIVKLAQKEDTNLSEEMGRYIATMPDPQDPLTLLRFEWGERIKRDDLTIYPQWSPIHVSCDDRHVTLFPHLPETCDTYSLVNVVQGAPSIIGKDISPRLETSEALDWKVGLSLQSPEGKTLIKTVLPAMKEPPARHDEIEFDPHRLRPFFYFPLAADLTLSTEMPTETPGCLGTGIFKIQTPFIKESRTFGSVLLVGATYNRLDAQVANEAVKKAVADPIANDYWVEAQNNNERVFDRDSYMRDSTQAAAYVDNSLMRVPSDIRVVVDPHSGMSPIHKFEDTAKKFDKVKQSLEAALNRLEVEIGRTKKELEDFNRLDATQKARLLEARATEGVRQAMEEQRTKLVTVRDLYDSDRINTDSKLTRQLIDQLGSLSLGYGLIIRLNSNSGTPLDLYLVAPEHEVTP